MDSILSSVLSIFSHNPIFVLAIIGYIAFSIIRGKNTEETEEYEDHESSGQTWEDMEREYGISIEKKPVEPSPEDLLYDEVSTTQQGTHGSSKKTSIKSTSFSTNTTCSTRESVTGPSLNERLAEFKRDKASKEGRVLLENIGVTTAPAVTSTGKRKANHALKEGMKWSIILGKPKALERRYR
jgi:hypothetical protein